MEVGVVFFMGVSNHIEISKEHPWSAMRGSYGPKLIEESRPLIRRGGSVHIGDDHRDVGSSRDEVGGAGMSGGRDIDGVEGRTGPRSKDATGAADSGVVEEAVKAARKERVQLEGRDGV